MRADIHKTMVVTGGSQGIGAALVTQARKAGHQVVFTGRNDAHIQSTMSATGAHGIRADVASDGDNQRQAWLHQMIPFPRHAAIVDASNPISLRI